MRIHRIHTYTCTRSSVDIARRCRLRFWHWNASRGAVLAENPNHQVCVIKVCGYAERTTLNWIAWSILMYIFYIFYTYTQNLVWCMIVDRLKLLKHPVFSVKLSLQTTIVFIFSKTVDRLIGFSIHLSGSGHGVACDVFRCLAKQLESQEIQVFWVETITQILCCIHTHRLLTSLTISHIIMLCTSTK